MKTPKSPFFSMSLMRQRETYICQLAIGDTALNIFAKDGIMSGTTQQCLSQHRERMHYEMKRYLLKSLELDHYFAQVDEEDEEEHSDAERGV